jgi:hypothetical protein
MPKYRVKVTQTVERFAIAEIEAPTELQAMSMAEDDAKQGRLDWVPTGYVEYIIFLDNAKEVA